jgi:hypothetical protein
MNWRRGLLLAGIHLAIAVPLVVWEEAAVWPYLIVDRNPVSRVQLRRAVWQEGEQTVTFDPYPCGGWAHYPEQQTILMAAELPAWVVSGWRQPCPSSWTVAGLIGASRWVDTRSQERQIAATFLVMIPLQWLFLGASCRRPPRRWYAEPGAFITACLVIAAIPLCIPPVLWASHVEQFPPYAGGRRNPCTPSNPRHDPGMVPVARFLRLEVPGIRLAHDTAFASGARARPLKNFLQRPFALRRLRTQEG